VRERRGERRSHGGHGEQHEEDGADAVGGHHLWSCAFPSYGSYYYSLLKTMPLPSVHSALRFSTYKRNVRFAKNL
jgi:hypothetical protein